MKPIKLLFILLLIISGWHAYDIVRTHTSGEVITYKSFARAVLNNDRLEVSRHTAAGATQPPTALQYAEQREERYFLNAEKVFTYYRVLDQRRVEDANRAFLRVEQITRVNHIGGKSRLWGAERVSIIHSVELVRERSAWRVVRFNDPIMLN